jgi:peptide/nickel transport system substrate-binding protein
VEQSVPYDPNAVLTYAVGPQPLNWDIHAAGSAPWQLTLRQVLAQVWPSAFFLTPSGSAQLNTSLLLSATQVSSNPQVVVYKIDPRAVWSDGTPITYKDFVYNWQAQSGRRAFRDKGGTTFTPMTTAGYNDIASVSGNPADPYTATVTFSTPYPDWESLFDYLMPAQVAERVGFGRGFTDPVADLVSGGPYLVAELQPGYSLELVRNASYPGPPANLATITYYFMRSWSETANALAAGELDVASLLAQPVSYQTAQAASGLSLRVVPTSLYEALDFNERARPFSNPVVRHAIMLALDRSAMVASIFGPYGAQAAQASPVEDRAYVPGAPGYVDGGAAYDKGDPAGALNLLTNAGYIMAGNTLYAPDGLPVTLTLSVDRGDPVAQQLAQAVVTSCAALGITVNLVPAGVSAGPLSGRAGASPGPGWQMAIEVRNVPPFPAALANRYSAGGPANLDGLADPTMNALLARAAVASGAEEAALYGQVDARAWGDFADLPLVAVPVLFASSAHLLNMQPGPYFGQVAWNEEDWGFQAP